MMVVVVSRSRVATRLTFLPVVACSRDRDSLVSTLVTVAGLIKAHGSRS